MEVNPCKNFNTVTTTSVKGGRELILEGVQINDGHNILEIKKFVIPKFQKVKFSAGYKNVTLTLTQHFSKLILLS